MITQTIARVEGVGLEWRLWPDPAERGMSESAISDQRADEQKTTLSGGMKCAPNVRFQVQRRPTGRSAGAAIL
ncbi:MAG: hypothetical protein ABSC25_26705 [Roseiarcus sp.]|jgi:hypothetical protein